MSYSQSETDLVKENVDLRAKLAQCECERYMWLKVAKSHADNFAVVQQERNASLERVAAVQSENVRLQDLRALDENNHRGLEQEVAQLRTERDAALARVAELEPFRGLFSGYGYVPTIKEARTMWNTAMEWRNSLRTLPLVEGESLVVVDHADGDRLYHYVSILDRDGARTHTARFGSADAAVTYANLLTLRQRMG